VKYATLLLPVLLAAQGCAATPPAVPADGGAQRIVWTRGIELPAFRDQDGTCHTFSRDSESAMHTLGRQVKACFEGSLPVVPTKASVIGQVKVAWQKVPAARIDELFNAEAAQSALHAAGRRRTASVFSVRGFYTYRGDTCHVVVSDHVESIRTLGHEFKHCVDGDYHDERGIWKSHAG
jgi:hypothetical protein